MQADRHNKHTLLAEKYAGSELKRGNMRELEKFMTNKVEMSPEVQKEFESNSETSNSWWWITWVLLQVQPTRAIPLPPCSTAAALHSHSKDCVEVTYWQASHMAVCSRDKCGKPESPQNRIA